ncbi:hypothetical protein SLS58_005784 [Diplodia intermedia]|uniref:1-alkyl-2-acetylglycerophosphocholine esterase n=1 Tax=Diplodia intermedia TaxID=856260 RepID=A0ABR3TQ33_9PEZI
MKPTAASALALLGIVSGSARAEILLYEPTGPYHVSQTQHVFNHTTPDDFTAPNGTGVGTLMLVTIYAPTLSVPNRTTPYMDATNADIWGPALGLAPSSLSTLVTNLQHDAPHLPTTTPPLPTILFLPGAGMPCFAYTAYLTELASSGYAVVALDHPGEPPYLALPGAGIGGVKSAFPPLHDYTWAQYRQIYAHRLADAAALLSDAYLPGLVRDRGWPFDLAAMGVFGHSIGGAAAAGVMAASAAAAGAARRQDPQPFSPAPDDATGSSSATSTPVLAGGANLDGWYFFDIGDLTGNNGTGEQQPYPDLAAAGPFLALAKEEPRAPPDATWANFGAAQSGWLRDVGVRRARHFDFGDFPLLVDGLLGRRREGQGAALDVLLGGVEGARVTAVVTGFLKAFFGAVVGRTGQGGLEAVDAFQKSVGEETWGE